MSVKPVKSTVPSESEFDSVQRGIEKLQHPTGKKQSNWVNIMLKFIGP